MSKITIKAQKRDILGRKVKKLRREGIIPANVYGKKIKSLAVQIPLKQFSDIYKQAGETNIVDLLIDGKKRSVLIHNVQIHPVTRLPIHADFHQVSLKEKITVSVPIELVGEARVVKEKQGTLLTLLNEIDIEALPDKLPDKIEVDISKLKEVGEVVKIGQLEVGQDVKIVTDKNSDILKVEPLVSKEVEELVREEEEKAEEKKEEAKAELEEKKADEIEIDREEKEIRQEKKETPKEAPQKSSQETSK